jgi:hypothetical protein
MLSVAASSTHGATMRTAKETARGLLLPISVELEKPVKLKLRD